MKSESTSESVREHAQKLFSQGISNDALVDSEGRVLEPIPVVDPDGDIHSWFVPIGVGEHLAGFLQILPDLDLMRYSTFQRSRASLDGCPKASLWIDSDSIRERARLRAEPLDQLGQPTLTYDGNPTRLVWAVPVEASGGDRRVILVAGDFLYETPSKPNEIG